MDTKIIPHWHVTIEDAGKEHYFRTNPVKFIIFEYDDCFNAVVHCGDVSDDRVFLSLAEAKQWCINFALINLSNAIDIIKELAEK